MKITVDPSQQKFVLPLVAVLVAAVGITGVRVKAQMGQAAPQQQAASGAVAAQEGNAEQGSDAAVALAERTFRLEGRNPFSAVAPLPLEGQGSELDAVPSADAPLETNQPAQLPPLALSTGAPWPGAPRVTVETDPATPEQVEKDPMEALESFALHAVLRGPEGWNAIISRSGGQSSSVSEGQALEEGINVANIGPGFVTLRAGGALRTIVMPGSREGSAQ